MTKLDRAIEAELVDLFASFDRNCVFDADAEPHIRYVRAFELANTDDDAIFLSGINKLSLRFVAGLLARKFGGVL
jgi:hypothetical protein